MWIHLIYNAISEETHFVLKISRLALKIKLREKCNQTEFSTEFSCNYYILVLQYLSLWNPS